MRTDWLFRKINLNLSTEVIFNICLLMMVAIPLIGFTLSKLNEKILIREKIVGAEGMVQDFQAAMDYMVKDKKKIYLTDPLIKKETREIVQLYLKGRGLHELLVVDEELKVVASRRKELIDQRYDDDLLKKSIQSGQVSTELEFSGGIFSKQYKKLILYSPLWFKGKVGGGIKMEIPIGEMMIHLLESQRVLLTSITLDAIVLIFFGTFLISRLLVKPLKDLVRLTQKVSDGDFSQKIEVSSKNEIGQLISSFNRMTVRLKENQEGLDNYLRSLEDTNQKLKQAQEELIRTEKLASIGRLAAGVAHEVGNPLGTILGYTSLLEKGGIDPEEAKDYLKRIEKEIERINRIVRGLLDFARPSKFEFSELQMNQVIENALSLLFYQKSYKNIETVLNLKKDLPMTKGDSSQLTQVLINMILNAVDAMPDGGVLEIETSEVEVESKKERLIRTRISDSGVGIPPKDIGKIFDPFFTTKAPDKGTGLGLSISLRIVESMGGTIRVESEFGEGSTFEIDLPAQ
jgi:signal transduction histidine kinase